MVLRLAVVTMPLKSLVGHLKSLVGHFEYLYLSPPMITLMRRMRGHFVMLIPS